MVFSLRRNRFLQLIAIACIFNLVILFYQQWNHGKVDVIKEARRRSESVAIPVSDFHEDSTINRSDSYFKTSYKSEIKHQPKQNPNKTAPTWIIHPWMPSLRGHLNVHVWLDWCGSTVNDLRRNIHFPKFPDLRVKTPVFHLSHDTHNYGQRVFGYLHPPRTGYYKFAISSDDSSELWLSTDDDPRNARLIAWVGNRKNVLWHGATGDGEFTRFKSQISAKVFLHQESRYFVEALHKQSSSNDHLLVAWKIPQHNNFSYITSRRVSQYVHPFELRDLDVVRYSRHVPLSPATLQLAVVPRSLLNAIRNDTPGDIRRPYTEKSKSIAPLIYRNCSYQPSYLVDFKVKRYEGIYLTHETAVFPDDNTYLGHVEEQRPCMEGRMVDSHGNRLGHFAKSREDHEDELGDRGDHEAKILTGQTLSRMAVKNADDKSVGQAVANEEDNEGENEDQRDHVANSLNDQTSLRMAVKAADKTRAKLAVGSYAGRFVKPVRNEEDNEDEEDEEEDEGQEVDQTDAITHRASLLMTAKNASGTRVGSVVDSHVKSLAHTVGNKEDDEDNDEDNDEQQEGDKTNTPSHRTSPEIRAINATETRVESVVDSNAMRLEHAVENKEDNRGDGEDQKNEKMNIITNRTSFQKAAGDTNKTPAALETNFKSLSPDNNGPVFKNVKDGFTDGIKFSIRKILAATSPVYDFERSLPQSTMKIKVGQDSENTSFDSDRRRKEAYKIARFGLHGRTGRANSSVNRRGMNRDKSRLERIMVGKGKEDRRLKERDSREQVVVSRYELRDTGDKLNDQESNGAEDREKTRYERRTAEDNIEDQGPRHLNDDRRPGPEQWDARNNNVRPERFWRRDDKTSRSTWTSYRISETVRRMKDSGDWPSFKEFVEKKNLVFTSKTFFYAVWKYQRYEKPKRDKIVDFIYKQNAAQCRMDGNILLNEDVARSVVHKYLKDLREKYSSDIQLKRIVNVEENHDVFEGDRYLIELDVEMKGQNRSVRFSDYVYLPLGETSFCYPQDFTWKKTATVHVIVPVKDQGKWVQHFIDDMSELYQETLDPNFNVIIVDFNSTDIDIEGAFARSALQRYQILKANGSFQRALGIQIGANAVENPDDILFTCDLHLEIPNNMIDIIRKHCVQGKMAFSPIVMRLDCGFTPSLPYGEWETAGFGLFAIYKSDFSRIGGMNHQEFTTQWGGEDWELVDRVVQSRMEIERLRVPKFYHYFHSKHGMWGGYTYEEDFSNDDNIRVQDQPVPLYDPYQDSMSRYSYNQPLGV